MVALNQGGSKQTIWFHGLYLLFNHLHLGQPGGLLRLGVPGMADRMWEGVQPCTAERSLPLPLFWIDLRLVFSFFYHWTKLLAGLPVAPRLQASPHTLNLSLSVSCTAHVPSQCPQNKHTVQAKSLGLGQLCGWKSQPG